MTVEYAPLRIQATIISVLFSSYASPDAGLRDDSWHCLPSAHFINKGFRIVGRLFCSLIQRLLP
jgi:hypothetical protein